MEWRARTNYTAITESDTDAAAARRRSARATLLLDFRRKGECGCRARNGSRCDSGRRRFDHAAATGSYTHGVFESYCRLGEARSEEHTSELQSHVNLVCRLLLEKKKY